MTDRKPLLQRWELRNGFRGEDAYKHEDGVYVLYVDYLADRAKLLAEIERLKEMVPRWVPVQQMVVLGIQGWTPFDDQKCGQSERLWLMVPPIPLPEKGDAG